MATSMPPPPAPLKIAAGTSRPRVTARRAGAQDQRVAARKPDCGANRARLPAIGLAVNSDRGNRHQMIGAETVQEPQRQCGNGQNKKRHRDGL
jgi:hypothetical protein